MRYDEVLNVIEATCKHIRDLPTWDLTRGENVYQGNLTQARDNMLALATQIERGHVIPNLAGFNIVCFSDEVSGNHPYGLYQNYEIAKRAFDHMETYCQSPHEIVPALFIVED